MTPEQWQLVKELFEAALERGPDDRAAFLIEATDDQDVRNEVESLLAAHKLDSGFMNEPADSG